ncbi:MAG TPA: type I restriction enzyme HsdR N-terminal domain-containing protein [Phycisphaerales bacterium]|nr:type I restriction enzyme HsdR N-terminal domain-containing protein [Phycisphaerales bacterium]
MAVPKKVCERVAAAMKRLRPVIETQRSKDVGEADTVTLVKDVLAEAFGYDKYADLTSELAIRGTYCDLPIRVEDKIVQLIEVKAIGISLSDRHVKQAVDYAANQGIEWVILTNAVSWRLYHVLFHKPIEKQLVAEVDLAALDCRREEDVERLYPFTKEGFRKGVHVELRDRQDATSRFLIAALLLHNDSVQNALRRELRRVVDINVSEDEIVRVLEAEVIKRDAVEGPAADEAASRVKRAENRALKAEAVRRGGNQKIEPANEDRTAMSASPPPANPSTSTEVMVVPPN